MNLIVVTSTKQNIKFGYEGEDNVTKIIFPYDESWLEYGEGNFEVRILRCGDEVAYTATDVVDDRQAMTLTMTVTDIELSVRGRGEMQLCYVCPDSIKKSPIYQYTVNRSVDYKYAVDPPEGSIIASVEKSLSEIKNTTNRLSNSVISIESSINDVNSQIDNINNKISEFDEEIDSVGEVETKVDNLETSIESINGRINTAEGNINENTESISDLNESVTELENKKVTDLETSGGKSDSGKYLTVGTDGKIKATSLTIPPKITVDESLSTTSKNPVQNKVIKTELNNINSNIATCNTEISKINGSLGNLNDIVNGQSAINYTDGKNLNASGGLVDAAGCCVSEFIPITWTGNAAYCCNDTTVQYKYVIAFYDANKTYIQQFKSPAVVDAAEYRQINHETQVTQGTAAFVRFSFKSGTVGKIANNARTENYWVAENAYSSGIVADIGDLSELITEEKDSLVGAINEVIGSLDDLDSIVNGETSCNYVEGKNISADDGSLVDESGCSVSEYIPYTWTGVTSYDCGDNTKLTYRIEFYDANKNHITGFRNPSSKGDVTYRGINVETQVTGGTVAYVRFSFKQGTVGRIFKSVTNVLWVASETESGGLVAEIGTLSNLTTDEKANLVGAINEINNKIPDVITPSDTDFFYTSPNILDPANVVSGQFVNQSNGEFVTNVNHTRTDYVSIVGGKTYCIVNQNDDNVQLRYAFYDSTKTFIPNSGGIANLADINYLVVAPATAKYIIISAITSYYPFMIANSNVKIAHANYGVTYLLPQYILSEDLTDLTVNLPSKIYAVTGFETNIYYENLVENWEKYNFNVSCSKGKDMRRGYTITPTDADAGSYTLSVIVSTKDGQSKKTASSTLVITPSTAGAGKTTKLLVLGDSTTANGTTIAKLHENFSNDSMTVNTLGTLGTAPNNMEGRGGWKFEFYNTLAERNGVTNPFYNPSTQSFDASYYFTNTGVTIPDWFFINLGINDMFEYTADSSLGAQIQRCIDYCDAMIASIKSASASIKIGICVTIPPNDSQDAFGKAYGCGQTRNRYKHNNLLWAKRLIAEYDNRESEGIYLIPIHTNLDTVYNMGMETLPVNARNTDVTYQSPILNGGVHPVESGYWQIADVYTAFLKANV